MRSSVLARLIGTAAATAVLLGLLGGPGLAPPAAAQLQSHDRLVSAQPTATTPHVLDGEVFAVAEVGNRIVLGGSFTQARNASGNTTVITRNRILAFDKATGQIDTGFAPSFNATVRTLVTAPDGSLYVGGQFGSMNGTGVPKIVRLNMSNGARIGSFAPPSPDAVVYDAKLSGNKLFIAGAFSRVGNQTRSKLAELDPTTGALRASTTFTFEGEHNPAVAAGQTMIYKIDVSPDNRMMVAIGNFRTIDGQDRVQIAAFDTSGAQTVLANWQTNAYKANCYAVFDYYIRDVDFAPDSSYFVTTSTGGYGSGPPSLCDTAVRWESSARGEDLRPSWVDYTGGDSLYAVAVTGAAVYVGGHNRWTNNPFRGDAVGPGAVEREGIAALDPANGMPLSWNPGRARGRGVFDMLATATGLYVGSDTDRIAGFQYRGRIALFPLAGGTTVPQPDNPNLPTDVTLVGNGDGTSTNPAYLYRINAGGPAVAAIDDGPDWAGDTGGSPYRNTDNNAATYGTVPTVEAGVAASTPRAVYSSERWDPQGGNEMAWTLPVQAGRQVELKLYLANRCTCTNDPGERVFDITVDGVTRVDDLDLSAQAGHDVGTVRTIPMTSDGTIDIRFLHVVENPLVNAIEVVDPALLGAPAQDVSAVERGFDGTSAGAPSTVAGTWNGVRGTVWVDGRLYTANSDGTFTRRSHDGTTFGAPTSLELYGLGAWVEDMQSMTSLFYDNGRLYFTRLGTDRLYWRYFSTESGIVGAQRFEATPPGVTWSQVRGAFIASGQLYWASAATGDLLRTAWAAGATSGGSTVVSGPTRDGVDWRARAMFAVPGTAPNRAPTATAGSSCTGTRCSLDGRASTDPDGSITAWTWTLPGGVTRQGSTTVVDVQPGTTPVTLSVTDNRGATGSTTFSLVTENAPPVAEPTVSCSGTLCTFTGSASTDPDGTVAGHRWSFGDGATGDGAVVEHRYSDSTPRTAELVVTDNRGTEGRATVAVDPANASPVASFTSSCDELVCDFDASASSDPDGTVVDWSWDLGDGGAAAAGEQVSRSYPTAGSYTVRLTVTDDAGTSASVSRVVDVREASVEHVGSVVDTDAGSTTTHEVALPSTVAAGDVMVVAFSTNSASGTVSDPAGWQRRATAATNGLQSVVWTRTATAADAGAAFRTTTSVFARGSLVASVYRGATIAPDGVALARETTSTASHRTPAVTAPAGGLLVSYWADKTASTTSWTAPAGHVVRQTGAGTGAGHLSWLLTDVSPTAAGTAGGAVAVADSATSNAAMASIVLSPAP